MFEHDSIADAVADLGKPDEIGRVFAGFQRYLYEQPAAGWHGHKGEPVPDKKIFP
jgi:hypothetical protein